jgi:uncharacterized alpha-E superfamily protein
VGNPEPDLAGHAAPPQTDLLETDPSKFFEWVKYRSHLSRGVTLGTMLRDEAVHFIRLGTFLSGPTTRRVSST